MYSDEENEINEFTYADNADNDNDSGFNGYIRPPDEVKRQRLIGGNNRNHTIHNNDDEETKRAKEQSLADFNNYYFEQTTNQSIIDYMDEDEKMNEYYIQLSKQSEMERRKQLLEPLMIRIHKLVYTEKDNDLKNILEPILINYIDCNIESATLPKNEYMKISEFLEILYEKPFSNGKKTAISFDVYYLVKCIITSNSE